MEPIPLPALTSRRRFLRQASIWTVSLATQPPLPLRAAESPSNHNREETGPVKFDGISIRSLLDPAAITFLVANQRPESSPVRKGARAALTSVTLFHTAGFHLVPFFLAGQDARVSKKPKRLEQTIEMRPEE